MKVRSKSSTAREIEDGQVVEPGQTVEVSDELGARLCEQPDRWQEVKTVKSEKGEG